MAELRSLVIVLGDQLDLVAAGIDVSTLAGVKFAYPTYSAVIGMAARGLLAEKAERAALA